MFTNKLDYIEKKSPIEYLNHLDRFGWGFPLIEGSAWQRGNFSKFKIFKEYPELWREFFGYIDIRKGDENEDFDVYVSFLRIMRLLLILLACLIAFEFFFVYNFQQTTESLIKRFHLRI